MNSAKAIIAEIEEEKSFKSWNPDLEHLETEVQLQAMKNRMIARSDAETARLEETADHNNSWFKFAHFGNVLGVVSISECCYYWGSQWENYFVHFTYCFWYQYYQPHYHICNCWRSLYSRIFLFISDYTPIYHQSVQKNDDYKMRASYYRPIKKEAMPCG